MIISRLGPDEWKREWIEEVQGLLERDAGWGWRGFWECVGKNLDVSLSSSQPSLPFLLRLCQYSYLHLSQHGHVVICLGVGIAFIVAICADDQDPPMELDDSGRVARDGYIHEIIGRYKKREEWEILDDVRVIVESIKSRLRSGLTL